MTAITSDAEQAQEVERSGRPWWLVLIEGIALIIIGLMLIASTEKTLVLLVQLIGLYWIIKGIFDIISIFIDHAMWGWKLFIGIVGIIAGMMILDYPLWSAIFIPTLTVWILGFYGLFAGIMGIVQAFRGGGWGLGVLGVVAILFGVILLANTLLATVALVSISGLLAIVGGIAAIVIAFKMR